MSDRLIPVAADRILDWMLREERSEGKMFGISRELFFTPRADDPFRMKRYGCDLETPVGVAAGPHTQLTQNIIAAWLTGARFLELKTVQTLDELEIARPCIDMEDEGYNCEWSQELKLQESYEEYMKAWVLLHLLRDHFGWDGEGPGFIFNMSVGYNLEGIKKPNVQKFLEQMQNADKDIQRTLAELEPLYPGASKLNVPGMISDSVTLSTMHGCPPDEIERIGLYLIEERRYHTAIKMNPTLLGPERLRKILNDTLGFEVVVPDEAFEHDIKYEDALEVIRNLSAAAERKGVDFGLKLTNTLETMNIRGVFPASEKMHYMSGRALHPISVNVARRLQDDFDGALDISFSAGADAFNTPELVSAGLAPVTVCSDLLKPGGYGRLSQYLEVLGDEMRNAGAKTIDEFATKRAGDGSKQARPAALENLRAYADHVATQPAYSASSRPGDSVKTDRELGLFDCAHAPCVQTCGVHQEIPDYLYYTSVGEFENAWKVIARTNPMPNSTGMVCDHLCQHKCMRTTMDTPLRIRDIKRFVSEQFPGGKLPAAASKNGIKVAVLGAGPAGLSCAYFLSIAGITVHIYESKEFAGGMVSGAIPEFRLTNDGVRSDVAAIENLVEKIHYSQRIDEPKFTELRKQFDYLFVGVGAQANKVLGIPGESGEGVYNQLEFLAKVRRRERTNIGKKVVVIGGGNSAVDAARTARRLVGKDGEVTVVYRRTRREMPADRHEVEELLEEQVKLHELAAPLEIIHEEGRVVGLLCQQMKLGEPDSSGRARPVPVEGETYVIEAEGVITAVGQDVVLDFLSGDDLKTDPVTGETNIAGVYAGGDAVRGAATLIAALGDGMRAAQEIQRKARSEHGIPSLNPDKGLTEADFQMRQARRDPHPVLEEKPLDAPDDFTLVRPSMTEQEARAEGDRCLYCSDYCSICVAVCPNRANLTYETEAVEWQIPEAVQVEGQVKLEGSAVFRVDQRWQTLNVVDFCNECGNCVTFCPTSGSPWRDKPRLYLDAEEFAGVENGFRFEGESLIRKSGGSVSTLRPENGHYRFESESVQATISAEGSFVRDVELLDSSIDRYSFRGVAEMLVLLRALKDHYIFNAVGAEGSIQ